MPRYKVLAPIFMNKTLHKPGHPKHGFVNTKLPLKPLPEQLEEVENETALQVQERQDAEKLQADADEEKVTEDKEAVDAVTFLESEPGTTVETL